MSDGWSPKVHLDSHEITQITANLRLAARYWAEVEAQPSDLDKTSRELAMILMPDGDARLRAANEALSAALTERGRLVQHVIVRTRGPWRSAWETIVHIVSRFARRGGPPTSAGAARADDRASEGGTRLALH
jgi:hypothetical protein